MRAPKHNMVQYSVQANCCNNCDFCLRKERDFYNTERQLFAINGIIENLDHIDWTKFANGVSLLGGELYYIKDQQLQRQFLVLIDKIIDIAKKVGPTFKYSTVTNGIYDPAFLYRVIDRFKERLSLDYVDINFSYDIKYRYHSEQSRLRALQTINGVGERYPDYRVGVQMILTQHVINLWKQGEFDIGEFTKTHFPKAILTFLYPHPIHTGKQLDDFFFNREDFFSFIQYMRSQYPEHYFNFINSTKNSGIFKYTGLFHDHHMLTSDLTQQPILSDGKEMIADCGHSELYRCYADDNKQHCMLCDIQLIEGEF